jgi:hypothetical protein
VTLQDDEDLDVVTIRAEIFRLRKVIGPESAASRTARAVVVGAGRRCADRRRGRTGDSQPDGGDDPRVR